MPKLLGKPSWSTPNSPPTFWNGITRPVDPVSTSKGTGAPLPTEAFTTGSVPPTIDSGTVPVWPLPPRDTDGPVLISGTPNRNSVGALITLMTSCWTVPSSPPRGSLLAAEFSELSAEPAGLPATAPDSSAERPCNADDQDGNCAAAAEAPPWYPTIAATSWAHIRS